MLFYAKFIIIPLGLFSYQVVNAQTDTLPLNHKHPKYEIAVLPITLYYMPDYFSNKNKILPVVGLSFKYFMSKKNAIRVAGNYSNINKSTLSDGFTQQKNYQKTQQYSVGFQHTFFQRKNFSTYIFTDFYYQASHTNASAIYDSYNNPSGHIYILRDSIVFYTRQVNSYNLVSGFGLKILDRKHAFASFETGLGVSYYPSGMQQAHGSASTDYSNQYTTSNGVQHIISPSWSTNHQLPIVDTKVKGVNLNGSIVRVAIGFIF